MSGTVGWAAAGSPAAGAAASGRPDPGPARDPAPLTLHESGAYPDRVEPHPGVGRFRLQHDADKPLIAFYGGVGLHDSGGGRWGCYNIRNRADIDRLIQRCRDYGVNQICAHLLEEWMPSRLLVQPPAGTEDLVPYAIEQAHAHNIRFYADIPCFRVTPKDKPFVAANPELLTRSYSGETDARMLSPAYAKVRAYRRAVILEWLGRYPLDGIQLDFIRWPFYGTDLLHGHSVHGYDEPLLRELREVHDLLPDYRPEPDDPRFCALRQRYVALFIEELRDSLRASGVRIPIAVYNSNPYGRVSSLHDVCQDWQDWEARGLVEEHHPMFLMDSMARLTRAVHSLMAVKQPHSIIFGPLFLAEGFEPADGFVPTAAMCRDAARRLIKQGCDGIWLCRSMEIEQFRLWPVVKEISRYSLRQIRAEDFDPLQVNLLVNGDFARGLDGWSLSRGDAASLKVSLAGLEPELNVELDPAKPCELYQLRRFSTALVRAVRSLGVSFEYRTTGLAAEARTPQVTVDLEYTSGKVDSKVYELSGDMPRWKEVTHRFRVSRARADTLKTATIRVIIPGGAGTLSLRSFEMVYDPLDNPLEMAE